MKNKILLLVHSLVLLIVLCLLVQSYQTPEERLLQSLLGVYEIRDDLQSNNSIYYPQSNKNTQEGLKVILTEDVFADEYPLPPDYTIPYIGQYTAFPHPKISIHRIDESIYRDDYDFQGGALRKLHPFSYFQENECYMLVVEHPDPKRRPHGSRTYDYVFFYIDGELLYSTFHLYRLQRVEA